MVAMSKNSNKNDKQLIQSLRSQVARTEEIRNTPAVRRVFGFLSSIGLLRTPENHEGRKSTKLSLRDVLKAGKVEPRVFEVLPAAMYAYPKSFLHQETLPEELQIIIKALHAGEERTTSYGGITYKEMKRWMHFQLPDKRTKPLGKKRILRTFSLPPHTCETISEIAKSEGISQADVIVRAIAQDNH